MPVFAGTRYDGQPYTAVRGKDGKVRKFLHFPDILSQDQIDANFSVHEVQAGEEIDEIANVWSKKPLLWWMIASVSGVQFPLDLEPGGELVIPKLEMRRSREPQILPR